MDSLTDTLRHSQSTRKQTKVGQFMPSWIKHQALSQSLCPGDAQGQPSLRVSSTPGSSGRSNVSRQRDYHLPSPASDASLSQTSTDTPATSRQPAQLNSPLMLIQSFLESLCNADKDGRIVVSQTGGHLASSSLKFLLLNPSVHFTDIVREARAIIVAGGTMQPVREP